MRVDGAARFGHHALVTSDRPRIVFLCVHNAGRSQMAAGWARALGGDAVDVYSGGSDPAAEVNQIAVAAMAEAGVDIASSAPASWSDEEIRDAAVVVTMGCGDSCPVFRGIRYEDWDLTDPAGLGLADVRPIRDEIEARVRSLLGELGITDGRPRPGPSNRAPDGDPSGSVPAG